MVFTHSEATRVGSVAANDLHQMMRQYNQEMKEKKKSVEEGGDPAIWVNQGDARATKKLSFPPEDKERRERGKSLEMNGENRRRLFLRMKAVHTIGFISTRAVKWSQLLNKHHSSKPQQHCCRMSKGQQS